MCTAIYLLNYIQSTCMQITYVKMCPEALQLYHGAEFSINISKFRQNYFYKFQVLKKALL